MILKLSSILIQDNNVKDLDDLSRKGPTLDDVIREQDIAIKKEKTVHRRRDLDSLG